jgi:hypothetical protein
MRAAMHHVSIAPRVPFAAATIALVLTAVGWHVRAVGTLERTRLTSSRNHLEWLVLLPDRRMEFAERRTYLRIMESMIEQGTRSGMPQPTRYPRRVSQWIGEL